MLESNVVIPSPYVDPNDKENQNRHKRVDTDFSQQISKRQKFKASTPKNSLVDVEALAAHKQALKESASGADGRPGFFYFRAPRSPERFTPVSYAVVGAGAIDQNQFQEEVQSTGKFRPYSIVERSPGGGASKVQTPGGTKLNLSINLGMLRIFSSEETSSLVSASSPISKENTPPQKTSKTQSLVFSDKKIGASSQKRKRKQRDVMHGRAIDEANAAGVVSPNERFEWLHLICFRMMGEAAQIKENLVAGTFDANTLMIPVESHLPLLQKYFGSNVYLHVSADLLPGTTVAKTINYRIEIQQPEGLPPIEIEFKFDALLRRPPSRRVKTAIDIYMKNIFKHAEQVLDESVAADLESYALDMGLQQLSEASDLSRGSMSTGRVSESTEDDPELIRLRRQLDFSDSSESRETDDGFNTGRSDEDEDPLQLLSRQLSFEDVIDFELSGLASGSL